MSEPDEMGLTPEAAKGYEEFFVPAIFDQWPPKIIAVSGLKMGDHVLEVGCGTGVFAREAVKHVGQAGRVVGLDLSESMLSVARAVCPDVEFHQGNASALPFDDDSFDVVAACFVLMFVPEPDCAVKEMMRVLKPGGTLVASVWESLENNPAYSEICDIARKEIDDAAATSLAWPFALGDNSRLKEVFHNAGVEEFTAANHDGRAIFPSIEEFVTTEIQAWLLADSVDQATLAKVIDNAKSRYSDYCGEKAGALDIPLNAIIVCSTNS